MFEPTVESKGTVDEGESAEVVSRVGESVEVVSRVGE